MLPTFIILFREILEISIILSIVLAATKGIVGRARWIGIGLAGGVAGSAVVAFFAGAISEAMEGMGQEIFNASILFAAVLMIGWTVVWMQQHGKELAQKIKHVGHSVHSGELPLYALAVIVSLSMWREGAEIVLFMYGILSTTQESLLAIITGGVAGTLAAAILGLLIYLGLIKLSTRYVFTVTSALLILLACGMSAQAAGYLVAAGYLPDLMPELWDTSFLLSESSLLGKILHAMLGYTERPTGIQALFYVVTFAAIFGLTRLKKRAPAAVAKTVAVVAAASVMLLCMQPQPANAAESQPCESGLEYELEMEDGKFSPSVLRVPSGKKFKLEVENEDNEGTLEFSIPSLGFELAVTPGQEYESYLGPLEAGEYPFEDALDSSRKGILKVE